MDKEKRTHGAEAMFASLWLLQKHVPDADVSFDMPAEQALRVRRNGIKYEVKQLRVGEYAVAAELPYTDAMGREREGLRYPVKNTIDYYPEAVDLLTKVIMADPRQEDLKPWNEHSKHFTVDITVPK